MSFGRDIDGNPPAKYKRVKPGADLGEVAAGQVVKLRCGLTVRPASAQTTGAGTTRRCRVMTPEGWSDLVNLEAVEKVEQ